MSQDDADYRTPVDRRMAIAREWDELVDEVRRRGWQDFLRPPSLDALLPAAAHGPIVIVNVSRWRCDALIITESGVRPCALPELTLAAATEQANTYLRFLQAAERAAEEHARAEDAVQSGERLDAIRLLKRAAEALIAAEGEVDDMLTQLQQWMWTTIAEPGDPVPRTVLDRVVSSYTPTIRALLNARAQTPDHEQRPPDHEHEQGGRDGRFLLVTVAEAPGQPPLRNVALERDAVIATFPPAHRRILDGPSATIGEVSKALGSHRYRWVHFSCHGNQNLQEPSRGGVLLFDGLLTVGDVASWQLRGDFAGLSACKTAVGGVDLLDEAITLAAALHYTGFRHVIGTMWSVDDEATADVFTALYTDLAAAGRLEADRAATALHDAVRRQRDAAPDEPRLWTPFAHFGP